MTVSVSNMIRHCPPVVKDEHLGNQELKYKSYQHLQRINTVKQMNVNFFTIINSRISR